MTCAVIGGGPAGMVTSAILRSRGLMVTSFEAADGPGGIWASPVNSTTNARGFLSPIGPSLRCVLPKDLMAFSDERFPLNVPQFQHCSTVQRYYEDYAEVKGIRSMTRYNTVVDSVEYDARRRRWVLLTVDVRNHDVLEWLFDFVIVAIGHTHVLRFPQGSRATAFEGVSSFIEAGGTVMHSSELKLLSGNWDSKKVIVVGDGAAAMDACVDFHQRGSTVYRSSLEEGYGSDTSLSEATDVFNNLPRKRRSSLVSFFTAAMFSKSTTGRHTPINPFVSRLTHFASDALRIPVLGRPLFAQQRDVTLATSSQNSQPLLVNDVDAVCFATGYKAKYPFLPDAVRQRLELATLRIENSRGCEGNGIEKEAGMGTRGLYLGVLWAENPSLAFIGLQNDLIPPSLIFESQARFAAAAFLRRGPFFSSLGDMNEANTVEAIMAREREVLEQHPTVAALYTSRGLGLRCMDYFNCLEREAGSSRTYLQQVVKRLPNFSLSCVVNGANTLRSMAPLKRYRQHVLFSNDV